jgi:hypothetical protein
MSRESVLLMQFIAAQVYRLAPDARVRTVNPRRPARSSVYEDSAGRLRAGSQLRHHHGVWPAAGASNSGTIVGGSANGLLPSAVKMPTAPREEDVTDVDVDGND